MLVIESSVWSHSATCALQVCIAAHACIYKQHYDFVDVIKVMRTGSEIKTINMNIDKERGVYTYTQRKNSDRRTET